MEQTSIEFLGGSQTFLGVLATIIILFIIANNSNLIREILQEVKKKISYSVEALKINTDLSEILNSPEYKLILWYQAAKKDDENDELGAETSKWTAKVNSKRQELQLRYMGVEVNNPGVLKKIEDSKEQLLAPFYSFIFCLVLFIFDELLKAYSVACNDILLTFLSLFIIESYVFWAIVWMNFIRLMRHDIGEMNSSSKGATRIKAVVAKMVKFREWYFRRYIMDEDGKPRERRLMFVRPLLLVAIVLCMLLYSSLIGPISPVLIVLLGVVFPLVVMGSLRLWAYECERKFTYVFLCGHVITLSLLALLLTVLFVYVSQWLGVYDNVMMEYSKMWMKISSFFFVGLNGIVLPFYLPYYCYNKYYRMAKKKVKDSKKDEKREVDALMNDIKSFAAKLPRPEA